MVHYFEASLSSIHEGDTVYTALPGALKSPFGMVGHRCEDNINVDVQEIQYEDLD